MFCQKVQPAIEEGNLEDDEDINIEHDRVKKASLEEMPVRVFGVAKSYGIIKKVKAVKKISFGLEFGECFALLGISGAGKSTLFKCLTGEI
jgi:ABC-type glutathione transport system ATPase component